MRGALEPFTVGWSFAARFSWIPAFAGMTEEEGCAAVTREEVRDNPQAVRQDGSPQDVIVPALVIGVWLSDSMTLPG